MIRVYRDTVATNNEISSQILGLSAFTYRIKEDWTFELPETTIVTTVDDFAPGEKIVVAQASDTSKQVVFYVKDIRYDYDTQKWTLTCPHILEKLAYVKTIDIPAPTYGDSFGAWSDVTPTGSSGYTLYNNQWDAYNQGDYIWERKYYQVLFLIKMLIHYVTGTSVNSIASSDLEAKDSMYADRWEYYGAHETIFKYSELGINLTCARGSGHRYWNMWDAPDYFERAQMTDCLTLLKYLLCALKIRIDIFRDDYKIEIIAVSTAPADSAILNLSEEALTRYRRYGVQRSGIVVPLQDPIFWPDYIWASYNPSSGQFHFYTWGVENPEREILTSTYERENTSVTDANQISVTYPNLFRIYRIEINTNNYYRSRIWIISDTINNKTDWHQWLDAFYTYWQNLTTKRSYETAMTGLDAKWPSVQYDLEKLKMRYERIT